MQGSFLIFKKNVFITLIVTSIFGIISSASSQTGEQFSINQNQGQPLNRDALFSYEPLGQVTIKIVFSQQNQNNNVSIDLTKPRTGSENFANDVLSIIETWQWNYPAWIDGAAYLTVNMIERSIRFDLSDLWRRHNGVNDGSPTFPNPEREKNSYIKYTGFNEDNVTIILSPQYVEQITTSLSAIKKLWQRLTPWFFILFVILLLISGLTIAKYLSANIYFLATILALSVILFILFFDISRTEVIFLVGYWIFWAIILGYSIYLLLTKSGVLHPNNLEGDKKMLKKIEKKWEGLLERTNTILEKYSESERSKAVQEWNDVVGIGLKESITELEKELTNSNEDHYKNLNSNPQLEDALSSNSLKEIEENLTMKEFLEVKDNLNEEVILKYSQKLSDETISELKKVINKNNDSDEAIDSSKWPSFAKILYSGMKNHLNNSVGWYASQEIDRGVDRAIESEIDTLRSKGLEILWSFGSIAPMLGLLGTVVGIASSFGKISIFSSAIEQSELIHRLAGGINIALYTTITGLIIGLLSLIFYYFLKYQLDKLQCEWGKRIIDITNRL